MTRKQLIVGHWYKGKSGKPRRIDHIEGVNVYYWRRDDLFTEICCLATFMRWAVEDIGTEDAVVSTNKAIEAILNERSGT